MKKFGLSAIKPKKRQINQTAVCFMQHGGFALEFAVSQLKTIKPRLSSASSSRLSGSLNPNWGQGRGGRAWRRLREQVLARDLYTCRHCLRVCLPENLCADHIINRANGGSDDLSNLQTLCTDCHKVKTANESRMGRGY